MPLPLSLSDDWLEKRFALRPPLSRLMDRRVVAYDKEASTADLEFTATEDFTNSLGVIQGGMLAAMLDSAVGMAALTTLKPDEAPVTIEMKVSYFNPAKPGALFAVGRVMHRGATIAHTEADLRDADGLHLARATATLRIVRPRRK
jgi:uncharacterized protein (TIGR00369 family)